MGLNAQTTVPTFTSGQVLTAAQQNQSARTGVPVFATIADRDAAFGGAGEKTLAEGQLCYIEDGNDRVQIYNGSGWLDIRLGYETYTPTVTAATGTLTTVANQAGRFTVVGTTVIGTFQFSITTNGTGGTALLVTPPVTFGANLPGDTAIGVARESGITGNLCQVIRGTTTMNIFTSTNGYPGQNGAVVRGSFCYEGA